MPYSHQQQAIEFITQRFADDPQVLGLLLSGSIAHSLHSPESDVDLNIVVSQEEFDRRLAETRCTFYEPCGQFYPDGYYDGKFITLDYLKAVAEKGNEPSRFALHDAKILFDKTGEIAKLQEAIGDYDKIDVPGNTKRFVTQLEGWNWFCGEALRKNNRYLLNLSVTKLVLFGGRLILMENRILFPYHKWFLRILADAPKKPEGLMQAIDQVINDPTRQHIEHFYQMARNYRPWDVGPDFSWGANFMNDVELRWLLGEEMVENL